MAIRKSNYERLRVFLDNNIDTTDFETQAELRILMNDLGIKTKTFMRTRDKQLQFAWNHLRKKLETLHGFTEFEDFMKEHYSFKYHEQDIYRAKRDLTIKGKVYKRGQFIPKR